MMFIRLSYYTALLVVFFTFFSNPNLAAQSPGGIDTATLWLRAGDLPLTTTNSSTASWPGTSGTATANYYSSLTGAYEVINGLNFNNIVQFNGDDYFEAPVDLSTSEASVFVVYSLDSTAQPIWGNGGTSVGKQVYSHEVSEDTVFTPYLGGNTINLATLNNMQFSSIVNRSSMAINGEIQTPLFSNTFTSPAYTQFLLGKTDTAITASLLDGKIAEVIIYKRTLSNLERQKVNSYLAIKYGITMQNVDYKLSNSVIVWDKSINNTHSNNITGIAKDATSGLDQYKSKSEVVGGRITIEKTGGIPSNNQALLWGNDGRLLSSPIPFQSSTNFFLSGERLERTWKCQKVGSMNGFNVKINASALAVPSAWTGKNTVLIVANDANFTTNVKAYKLRPVGGEYEAINVQLNTGQYFTYARMSTSLWVKGDAPNTITASNKVTRWYDNIGGINTMIANGDKPNFIGATASTAMNYNAYVQFNPRGAASREEYLEAASFRGFGVKESSVFLVARRDNSNTPASEALLSYAVGSSSDANEMVIVNPSDIFFVVKSSSFSGQNNNYDMVDEQPHLISHIRSSSDDDFYFDGGNHQSDNLHSGDRIRSNGSFIFGQEQDLVGGGFVGSQEYQGDMAEAIIFSKKLDTIAKNKVESYLAIKYGIGLRHNYYFSNGDVTWDIVTNSIYHNNVAGVGRDDYMKLNQVKSKSQNIPNVLVEIDAGTLTQDSSHLIWGSDLGDYDDFTQYNTYHNMNVSERVWKVQNYGGRVGGVTVIMDNPSLPVGQTYHPILLVANGADFASTASFPLAYTGNTTVFANKIVFTNVVLPDGYYFTLGLGGDVVLINNDAGAPSTFEACPGSSCTFFYSNLSQSPNRINLVSNTSPSGIINIIVVPSNTSGSPATGYSGEITFIVPPTASSGDIKISAYSTVLYQRQNFIIHNPSLDFFPANTPLCATDTIALNPAPSGGVFSATGYGRSYPSLIHNNSIIGSAADWNISENDISKNFRVTYTYRPTYIDGSACLNTISTTKRITIRDNRLTTVNYNPLLAQTNPPTVFDNSSLTVNSIGATSSVILSLSPKFPSNVFPSSFSYSYTGTYVYNSTNTTTPTPPLFLADHSGIGIFPVTFQYNNDGCIGEATGDLRVYPPLRFIGLRDTMCREAAPSRFTKDILYPHYNDTTYIIEPVTGDTLQMKIYEYNRVVAILVDTVPNHPAVSPSLGIAAPNIVQAVPVPRPAVITYSFDASRIDTTKSKSDLQMHYMTYIKTIIYDTAGTTTINSDYLMVAYHTVYLEDRPIVQIPPLQFAYCTIDPVLTLNPSPPFDFPGYTHFEISCDTGSTFYDVIDTLKGNTLLDFAYHHERQTRLNNLDKTATLGVELIYTVDRYGCVDKDTVTTRISPPVNPHLLTDPSYCSSFPPIPLNVGFTGFRPAGVGTFDLDSTWMGTASGGAVYFYPDSTTAGLHPIKFQYTDLYGCTTILLDTILLVDPPAIETVVDSPGRVSFCANETAVFLHTEIVGTGVTVTDSSTYTGRGVYTIGLFDPNAVYQGGSGATHIYTEYTDTFGCIARHDLTVNINPIPNVSINGFLNLSPNLPVHYEYCYSDPSFAISGSPAHTSGQGGFFSGNGVVLNQNSYYYNTSFLLLNQDTSDAVVYTYTDNNGCIGSDSISIVINSSPTTTFSRIEPRYCINDPVDSIVGAPNYFYAGGSGFYTGVGINSSTGLFFPSRAGTGQKIISYTYTDLNQCSSTVTDTIHVDALPIPVFGGYSTQYCQSSANDIFVSLNDTTNPSSYFFWGHKIIDSTGIFAPGFGGTNGTEVVYYAYSDTFGCQAIDSVNIHISPSPHVEITGLDSAYCFGYAPMNISVSPAAGVLVSGSPVFQLLGSNTVQFVPNVSSGYHSFTYSYRDPTTGCVDTLEARTYVHQPQMNGFTGLDTFYCKIPGLTYLLTGLDPSGLFSGVGVISRADSFWYKPTNAAAGIHDVTYSVLDTFIRTTPTVSDTLVCSIGDVFSVEVRDLPRPSIITPTDNSAFCNTDTAILLNIDTSLFVSDTLYSVLGVEQKIDTFLRLFVDSNGVPILFNGTLQYLTLFDTTYYFNPLTAATGANVITYTAKNEYGCKDSVHYTYIVNQSQPTTFILDSAYCESDPFAALFGIPAGGQFWRNGNLIPAASSFYTPNASFIPGDISTSIDTAIIDTLVYMVQYGACNGIDTQYVKVNPVPNITFYGSSPTNAYCSSEDTIRLTMQPLGGLLQGNGIANGHDYILTNIAQVGNHIISYYYQDTMTTCENTAIDTVNIYGQPTLDFEAIGGCSLDSVLFRVRNQISGIGNINSNGIQIDSITSVQWDFEGNGTYTSVPINSNNILVDSAIYVYSTPNIYYPKLVVINQGYCTDTTDIRLVISPLISNYPYDETFENSDGNWFPENKDTTVSLLWEYGSDNNNSGISVSTNKMWATRLSNPYVVGGDGWVYSPCFDLDTLDRPMIKLDYWSDATTRDGTVLQYQKLDGTWGVLGDKNRGINWYNSSFVAANPGDQGLTRLGWSDTTDGWVDARYKLDEFLNRGKSLRLRIAFAAYTTPTSYYDGFAFDNVWIGNRTRNVLLETTSNEGTSGMIATNNYVYQLAFHTEINKDVVLIQYNCCGNNDEFYRHNPIVSNVMQLYGSTAPQEAFIDGFSPLSKYSMNLKPLDFEQEMLESPKFDVKIDSFRTTGSLTTIVATVTANENMPSNLYHITTMITEDSLVYTGTTNEIHAVARKNDEGINTFTQAWQIGDSQTVQFVFNHGQSGIAYNPSHFQAVVFIQNNNTHEVFQVATSRDVSGYRVGPFITVDKIEGDAALAELNTMNLYPNPARNYFKVDFDENLKRDYQWKLVDLRGVEIRQGAIQMGENSLEVDSQDLPTGVYIFVIQNDKVFSQRKVIINNQ